MSKNVFFISLFLVVFWGCQKEEPYVDKTEYYGCNSSSGFNARWHFWQYAVNDTSVHIFMNDTVEFFSMHLYHWNDTITGNYTTCYTPAYSYTHLELIGTPFGTLTYRENGYAVANGNPSLLRFDNTLTGDVYYFWGERLP